MKLECSVMTLRTKAGGLVFWKVGRVLAQSKVVLLVDGWWGRERRTSVRETSVLAYNFFVDALHPLVSNIHSRVTRRTWCNVANMPLSASPQDGPLASTFLY